MQRLKKLKWTLFKPRIANLHGVVLEISDPKISEQMKRRIYLGDYEKEEREIMEHTLSVGDRVLEFGSGIGYLATYCALRLGEDSVVTVEGNPEMESVIRRNFALNGVSPTLKIGLVGAQSGKAELHFEENFWSNSVLPTANTVRSQVVPMFAALSLIQEHHPTVLICDIEGGEQAVLPQLPLNQLGLRDIIVELHPKRLGASACSDIVAHIINQGFIVNVAQCRFGTMTFRRRDAA
jgi:FkbM family methyltransferase